MLPRDIAAGYIAANRAAGLCRACPQPAAPDRAHCAAHLVSGRERHARLMRERDAAGLCRSCGEAPREPNGKWCADCRHAERIAKESHRAA
jgi:hypothetical protein